MLPFKFYVFSGSSSSTAAGGRISDFAIRTFGMLLFDVSIKCRVTEVSFVAELTLVVPPVNIIFGAAFSFSCFFRSFWVIAIFLVPQLPVLERGTLPLRIHLDVLIGLRELLVGDKLLLWLGGANRVHLGTHHLIHLPLRPKLVLVLRHISLELVAIHAHLGARVAGHQTLLIVHLVVLRD